ncbi:MAG: hypothetical protein R2794_13200 [Chitinophagales bacterium]
MKTITTTSATEKNAAMQGRLFDPVYKKGNFVKVRYAYWTRQVHYTKVVWGAVQQILPDAIQVFPVHNFGVNTMYPFKELHPVLLYPALLRAMGFDERLWYAEIRLSAKQDQGGFAMRLDLDGKVMDCGDVRYVHEMQNAYFAHLGRDIKLHPEFLRM